MPTRELISLNRNSTEQSRKERGKNILIGLLAAALLAAVVVILVLLSGGRNETEAVSTPTPTPLVKNTDTIDIPGYECLQVKADTEKQEFALNNPAQNTCRFKITITLADGTELWQSDLIEPGKTSETIVFSRTLAVGSYPDTRIHYDCFAMDADETPLNSAEIKVTLLAE